MNTLSAAISMLTHSLAWALLYSLWQGLLVYACLFVVMRALPNVNARLKHYLSFGAYTALFAWFADTWIEQYQQLRGVTVYITQSGVDAVTTTTPVQIVEGADIHSSVISQALHGFDQSFPLFIGIYCIGVAFMLVRITVNMLQVRTLKSRGLSPAGAEWDTLVLHWQKQFDIGRKVSVYLSDRINVPMMLGVLKPVILLPVATLSHLTTEQVEAVLLHELAHIKRHDYLLNIFQAAVETLLFFNPFVWLISAIIRREREHCCDDLVVSCATSPLPYAKALALLEHFRVNDNSLALAATGHKNQLFNRIKRIMEMKKSNINYSKVTIVVVAVIAITFTAAMFAFSPSFAQKANKPKSDDTTSQKKSYVYKYVTVDSNGHKKVVTKTSATPLKEDDEQADNVNISISVNDNGTDKTEAHAYINGEQDEELKKIIKEVVTATNGAAKAVASIDMKKISKEMEAAQKEIDGIDWDEMNADIKKALAEVNKELANPTRHKEISIQVKKELEKSKAALEDAGKHMSKQHRVIIKTRAGAGDEQAETEEIRGDGPDFESMLAKMEKEGLINRSGKFKIEKDNDDLFINGQKQSNEVFMKYHEYLKDKSVTISGSKGSLAITVND